MARCGNHEEPESETNRGRLNRKDHDSFAAHHLARGASAGARRTDRLPGSRRRRVGGTPEEAAPKRGFAMKNRGLGYVYQPSWRDPKTGGRRSAATWWISYSTHGKRHRENAHSTKEAVASKLLKLRLGQAAIGMPVGPQVERTTLDDILKMVEVDYAANGRKSLPRVKYAATHLRELFDASAKARTITADRVTAYQAERLEQGAKSATANYELAILRRAFRLGARAGKVAGRPEIQMLHVENTRKGFFELEQHRAVLKHLPEYLRPMAAMAYVTGWRAKSELLTRQWRHVDFANGWIRLDPGESKNGEGREFPFTPEVRGVLESQREFVKAIERKQACLIPWVFVHPDGRRIKDFRISWANACKNAGVPGRLVHDFRRTAVRNLERAGVPRSAAMRMTGHKTEAVYRRYAITDFAMLQEAAVKLAAFHAADSNSPS
jgi:integrase